MTNVTTTLQRVRPDVRTAAIFCFLLFLFIYSSLIVLGPSFQLSEPGGYIFNRYLRYTDLQKGIGLHNRSAAVGLLLVLRLSIVTMWVSAAVSMSGAAVNWLRVVSVAVAAESVFLVPAWLEVLWLAFFQSSLNELPPGSFEPLSLFKMGLGSWSESLRSLNSYWLMYAIAIAFGVSSNGTKAKRLLPVIVLISLLLGLVLVEVVWVLL